MLKPNAMPAPETLIDYGLGFVGAVMFHYAGQGDEIDLDVIAMANGFETRILRFGDDHGTDPNLCAAIERGEPDVCARWHPVPPAGWQLGAMRCAYDGPVACFIKKVAAATP